jgi:hypothetical protein
MQRRSFLRVTAGGMLGGAALGCAGLAGCSQAMPPQAIEAWRGPGPLLPGGDLRHWLLAFAILAPHSHNLQSWRVSLSTPGEIWLACDLTRLLPQTDPQARQIMMSHGTFLELLDMAAKEQGYRADITLFPEGIFSTEKIDTRPVARIRLLPDPAIKKEPLFAQVLLRHTNRSMYELSRDVPAAAWEAMRSSVDGAQVRVSHVGLAQAEVLAAHRRTASAAFAIELSTPRTVMESYALLRVGATEVLQHRDGLSLLAPLPVALARLGLFDRDSVPTPDDYATTSQIEDFDKKLASTPGFLVMTTPANDRVSQIRAGRAYVRVQLAATALGLAMQPLQQALQEYPEQRQPYADIHRLAGVSLLGETVQMWARVGYASPVEPAPRRRLQDFIVKT